MEGESSNYSLEDGGIEATKVKVKASSWKIPNWLIINYYLSNSDLLAKTSANGIGFSVFFK